jgi:hypothetical protein
MRTKIITRQTRKRIIVKYLVTVISLSLFSTYIGKVSSFAWFTSSASSSNSQITVGKFKLDLETGDTPNVSNIIFDGAKLQPGISTQEKIISFINSGDIEMVLKGNLSLQVTDTTNTHGVGDKNAYKIIATIYKNNIENINKIYSTVANGLDESTFNTELNSVLDPGASVGSEPKVFQPNDKLICCFKLVLDGVSTTKAHQGDTVTGSFKVEARQNIVGAPYQE